MILLSAYVIENKNSPNYPDGHKEIVADDGAGNVITYNRTSYTQTKTSSHETGKVVDSHGNTIESIDITKTVSKNATTVTSIV